MSTGRLRLKLLSLAITIFPLLMGTWIDTYGEEFVDFSLNYIREFVDSPSRTCGSKIDLNSLQIIVAPQEPKIIE